MLAQMLAYLKFQTVNCLGCTAKGTSILLLIIEKNCIGLSLSPIYIYFFPLFYDQAMSVAMIRHSMDVVKKSVEIIILGQVSIITIDQPLYTIAKQIQWSWPDTYGEYHFVVIFSGLHIEMTILKVLGDLLEGRGWTAALVQADIASTGAADSLLKASHVTRPRNDDQVTACALCMVFLRMHMWHIQVN